MMAPGPHVFEDGRVSCYVISSPTSPPDLDPTRLAKLRGLGITDLLLRGPEGTPNRKKAVLDAGFVGCGAWWAVDELPVARYVQRCITNMQAWAPGFADLNIELPNDPPLEPYIRQAVAGVRSLKPNYRLRICIAPRKYGFVPVDLLQTDPNLYVSIQNYGGNMEVLYSAPDQERGLRLNGVPDEKIASTYAAACTVGGITGSERVSTLPNGWALARGTIFSDQLLVDAGLL